MISRSKFEASQTCKIAVRCCLLNSLRDLGNTFDPDLARISTILQKDIHKEMDDLISTYCRLKFLTISNNFL